MKKFSKQGYKKNSPDRNNPYNVIPSGRITMEDVLHPVYGIDDLGYEQMMYPGYEYQFPGSIVTEIPMQYGGQAYQDSLLIHNWGEANVKRLKEAETMDSYTAKGFEPPFNVWQAFNRLEDSNDGVYKHIDVFKKKLPMQDGSIEEAGAFRWPKPVGTMPPKKRPYVPPIDTVNRKEISLPSPKLHTSGIEGIPSLPEVMITGYQQTWDPNLKKWTQEPVYNTVPHKQQGGEVMELSDEEIEEYRKGGYVVEEYQDGGPKYGTPEYRKAYEQGTVTRYNPETDTYQAPNLPEFQVKPRSFMDEMDQIGHTAMNFLGEMTGVNPATRIIDDPVGTAKGTGQTIADLMVYGTPGVKAMADADHYFRGTNPNVNPFTTRPYWEGVDQALDVAGLLPIPASKSLKLGKLAKPALKNTYKINPWAFKPQEGMMYRGLGKEGMEDAIQSGVFRPKQHGYAEGRSLAEKVTTPKQFGSTFYAPAEKFGVVENYGPSYLAEVPFEGNQFARRYGRKDWSWSTPRQIPINEGRLLQKDWLRGYKEVPISNIPQTVRKSTVINPIPSSTTLPKELEPYLSKIKPKYTREEEIFNSFLSPETRLAKDLENTQHFYPKVKNAGFDGNFLTRPLTPFTKNELTPGKHLYRKIGNKKGLQDLIDKGGAQAPGPLRMKSNQTVHTPFFGVGKAPNENYRGIFAVEHPLPSQSKYDWSSRVGGTDNYGMAPFDNEGLVKNIPLEDLNVYRKKWFSNNYKKLDPNNLEAGLKGANTQVALENAWKWGSRGAITHDIIQDDKDDISTKLYKYYKEDIQNQKPVYSKKGKKYYEGGKQGWLDEFEDGGEIQELTPQEIEKLRAQGYIVDEL